MNMDTNIEARLQVLEEKINLVFISVEKTRKYILAIAIITVVATVLPIIGLLFAIPKFLRNLESISTF